MRMSCNGCRVLRKGCDDDCIIKPCLQWIKSPKSQANATLFLAKFYGRTGLINLINAGPQHLRPEIFRSLLYEACGRIANPIYGSVGLFCTQNWDLCQSTVEAVLRGDQITIASSPEHAIRGWDVRHVSKDASSSGSDELHKVKSKSRSRFKKSAPKTKLKAEPAFSGQADEKSMVSRRSDSGGDRSSVETVEASVAKLDQAADGCDVDLELTLGFK
ncbi:LOB domain-containing protein 41-like [Euphorbia lathyris]|uniref:LOB domain-containing protein 41-like n=1 Tax=Euphorbia lathyris TaxID=212925 RepID=UPI003313B567